MTLTAHLPHQGRAFASAVLPDADHPTPAQTELTLSLRTALDVGGVLATADGRPLAGATLRFHPVSTDYIDDL